MPSHTDPTKAAFLRLLQSLCTHRLLSSSWRRRSFAVGLGEFELIARLDLQVIIYRFLLPASLGEWLSSQLKIRRTVLYRVCIFLLETALDL